MLSGLHVLSRCFSRSNPCITGFTSIRRCQWKMQSPRLHSRPPGSASCDRGQGLGIVTSTFSNPDACEVQESLHYFMLHVRLNCNLLSFHSSDLCLNSYGKKRKKKSYGLWDMEQPLPFSVAGGYKCVSKVKLLLGYQVFTSMVGGLSKGEIFPGLMVAGLRL